MCIVHSCAPFVILATTSMVDQSALLAHIVSQTRANIDFLATHNQISQSDARDIISKLPGANDASVMALADRTQTLMLAPTSPPPAPRVAPSSRQGVRARAIWGWNENAQVRKVCPRPQSHSDTYCRMQTICRSAQETSLRSSVKLILTGGLVVTMASRDSSRPTTWRRPPLNRHLTMRSLRWSATTRRLLNTIPSILHRVLLLQATADNRAINLRLLLISSQYHTAAHKVTNHRLHLTSSQQHTIHTWHNHPET